jgi:hypothetical protein
MDYKKPDITAVQQQEKELVEALDDMRVAGQFIPGIREALESGGAAELLLKKAEPIAALRLLKAMLTDKAEVSVKAAIEVLNRVSGKAVERRLNVYADIQDMNESQLDREIAMLAAKQGIKVLDVPAEVKKLPAKRKPKKQDEH